MRYLLLLFSLVGLFACSTEELEEKAKIDKFFDLEGTLDQIAGDLAADGAILRKEIVVNDETETFELSMDSIEQWRAQFELFYEADINKLGLSNSYQSETLQAFDGIEKEIYTAIKKDIYVRLLECSYRDDKLFTIRILASDQNLVYGISSEYILYFNHFNKKLALDHFTIKTEEHMLFKDDLNLEVRAEVIRP